NPDVSFEPRWHQRSGCVDGMSIAFNIRWKAMPVGANALVSIDEAMDCYIKRNVGFCRCFKPGDQFISCHDIDPRAAPRIGIYDAKRANEKHGDNAVRSY